MVNLDEAAQAVAPVLRPTPVVTPVPAPAAKVAPVVAHVVAPSAPAAVPVVVPTPPMVAAIVEQKPAPVVAKPPPTFALSPKDRTIRAGLERWANSSGWKLAWELPDGTQAGVVQFDADFGADFDVALSKLAAAMRSETKVHAYLYASNKVLRIVADAGKAVASSAVPMTPTIQDAMQKDAADRGLPYVTRVKGYWLGASGTTTADTPESKLPSMFSASVSLVFSEKATLATVIGILSKVTGIPIALNGALEYPADALFINDPAAGASAKGKPAVAKGKKKFTGTPKALLDRISISTGLLWEFKDDTIVFTE